MKILLASPIDSSAMRALEAQHEVIRAFDADEYALKKLLADRDILIFRSGVQINADVLSHAPVLKFVIRAGSGLDNIDLDALRARKIRFERIPEPGAQAVAEMTFALIFALSRNVVTGHQLLSKGKWAKYEMKGHLISGKTLGVVGMGNIGAKVAMLGKACGMRPIGCVANPSPERAAAFEKNDAALMSFEDVISKADVVSLHLPLNSSTRYMIDRKALAMMKPGAFLVNLARGGVADEQALYHALTQNNGLKGAALDVHEQEGDGKISPLAGLPNVILTPHIGAMAFESQQQIGRRVLQFVETFEVSPVPYESAEAPAYV